MRNVAVNNGLCCGVACFAGFGDAGRDGDTSDVVEPSFSAYFTKVQLS